MASHTVRPPDLFPVAELRAAARAAGEAVDGGDYLQGAVEQLSELVGSERCSLLVLRDGRLFHGGSVGLPAGFMAGIDGAEIGPHVGTCGSAAFRGRAVVTADIPADPKWEGFRHLAAAAGLRSCWSVPVRLSGGPVMGTFAAYGAEPGVPDQAQLELAEAHASLVALGMDRLGREERLSESYEAVVLALSSALDVRDEYTGAHSTETARMAVEVGRRMGLGKADLQRVEQAAMLHDIGKLGVPTEILLAPRALTAEERGVMEQHPVIGERILRGIPYLEDVARAVRHEHERWDGQGYPDGLAGEDIPLASRVVFACDAWHAMTSDRPYRKALDAAVARAELAANAGTQFDPRAVEAVLEVVGGEPPARPAECPREPEERRRGGQRDPGEAGARLAGEDRVLEATRAVTAVTGDTVEAVLGRVAEIVTRSLSCAYGGVWVYDDAGEARVGEVSLGWAPPAGSSIEESAPRADELEFPVIVQDVPGDPFFGALPALSGAAALHAVELGDPRLGVLFVVRAGDAAGGFTPLCRRLTRSVAGAAEVVIRRALAAERAAES